MSCCKECPICMDDISETNCVVTECGHNFHTSCLMKNVAHNGFGCPYCRTTLAEVPEEEDQDNDDDEEQDNEEEEIYGDHALRGMRWLFQRIQNEPLDDEDDLPDEDENPDNASENEESIPKPSAFLVTQKLMEQGVTMEDIVKCLLSINHEEYEDEEEFEQKEDEIFGKFRIIISNYRENEENEYHRLYPRLLFPIQEERERQVQQRLQQREQEQLVEYNKTLPTEKNEILILSTEAESKEIINKNIKSDLIL